MDRCCSWLDAKWMDLVGVVLTSATGCCSAACTLLLRHDSASARQNGVLDASKRVVYTDSYKNSSILNRGLWGLNPVKLAGNFLRGMIHPSSHRDVIFIRPWPITAMSLYSRTHANDRVGCVDTGTVAKCRHNSPDNSVDETLPE